jgi:peptidoglycan/xylan/chitin deacetylase (PgdA/CDA1 family)
MLRTECSRALQEAPRSQRPLIVFKRIVKVVLAASSYYSGVTGRTLRQLLCARAGALVLGYHGVSLETQELFDSQTLLANLEGQIIYLSKYLRPVSLEAIVASLTRGEAPPAASFAVTFDDGLLNNVTLAIPLLHKLGMSATFFVPSGLVGSQRDLWIASLTEVIRSWPGEQLPAEPGLWPGLPLRNERERYIALFRVKLALKTHEAKREEILSRLAGRSLAIARPADENRVVNAEQLRKMTGPGLSVGAHSRNHPILSGLDPVEARNEISGSRSDLEGLTGTRVLDFAYPNGRFTDFNDTTRRLVAEAGFRCAVTTEPGAIVPGDDVLALRRCLPENVPAFLAAFDLLIRVWKDRRRPADGVQPVANRLSYLRSESAGELV